MPNAKQFYGKFKGASIDKQDTSFQQLEIERRLEDKYFNLFCSSHKIEGNCVTDELRAYIYRRFWLDGTICFFNIKNTELLGACKYAVDQYDMYNEIATILPTYINGSNQIIPLVPHGKQVVNKDVVIGYYQRNRLPVIKIVRSYCEQLADIEMVINTNLQLHKLPFIFEATEPDSVNRLTKTIQKIVNNELVIGVAQGDASQINAVSSNTPYIIDKLYTYKCDLENELKTYLGLNNSGVYQKASHTLEAEVESSQQDVNDMLDNVDDELEELSKRVKKTLGKDIRFIARTIPDDAGVEHMDKDKKNGEAYQDD